jgi:hypothetical protein
VRQSTDRIGQEGFGLDDQLPIAHLGRGSPREHGRGSAESLIRRDLSGTAGLWLSRTRFDRVADAQLAAPRVANDDPGINTHRRTDALKISDCFLHGVGPPPERPTPLGSGYQAR